MIVSSFRDRLRGGGRTPEPEYASISGFDPRAGKSEDGGGTGGKSGREPDGPVRRPRTRGSRIRRLILALFVIFIAVPALLMALFYWSAEIPSPSAMRTNQIATITAADGTTVIAKVVPPEGNRTPVPLAEVPVHVRNAMLSAEDRNFYTNPGYSIPAFLRAARDNLLGKENAGGGSTITQQYVKNAFLDSERTVTRKMRELVIAAKMAREWSKDDILAAYLNTIYYGRGAYGIAAAAKAYFNKPVPELTLAEGAVLAALVRSPSILDPETHLEDLKARWRYVLDGMVEMGVLNRADRETATFPPVIPITDVADDGAARGPEGLIRAQVLRELRAAGISEHELNTGALQITTTIEPKAQQAAVAAAQSALEGQPPELRTAVVSIDPRTGAVRAYYGGADGVGFDFAQAPVQTGSAFKTFAVLAAQRQGISMAKQFDSSPVQVNDVLVRNVDNESCGTCSLAEAFKRSLNTSFYRLTQSMFNGPQAIADAAHQAGIPEEIPGVPGRSLSENGGPPAPSIVLGVYQVRPIDMASAYATIAASGMYHQPYFVQRVVTGTGRVLLDRGAPEHQVGKQLPPGEQRFPAAIANRTIQAMLPIAAYSNGHALDGRPSAAKTGTTQLGDTGENKDAWMVGFTPSLSTAVWVGTEHSQAIRTAGGGRIYGSGLPADIWKQTMDGALEGTPAENFPAPEGGSGQPIIPAGPPQPSGGPYDILNPPPGEQPRGPEIIFPPAPQAPEPEPREPIVIFPPAPPPPPPPPPPRQVEILPGIVIPVPG
ncbi:transglycosylase domain-containing protein [Nocardia cyriacigeorgica]|uniref:transglycosylase domain-containing protein n=1 Tax=Nocardia cyriacigeorgica TaxID=135487 RepID=UPI002453C751|nr:transglycosylase domain-containing protein [Nocardia cyriacigeorgica]